MTKEPLNRFLVVPESNDRKIFKFLLMLKRSIGKIYLVVKNCRSQLIEQSTKQHYVTVK